MRKLVWLAAAGLAASTAGCVESMDDGYSRPAYGYYSRPVYYEPAPVAVYRAPTRVVTETRYVPVAVPANDRRADTRRTEHHRASDRDRDRDGARDRWQH